MDHNLNLLKSQTHKDTQDFMDMNFDNNLFPLYYKTHQNHQVNWLP